MNKFNKKSIFAIVGLVLVLAISLVLPLGTAFADYEDVLSDTNSIVNFNQLINQNVAPTTQVTFTNGDYFVNGTLSSGTWLYLNITCRIYSDHIYYFYVNQSNISNIEVVFDLSGANFRTSNSKVLSPSASGEAPLYFRVNQSNTFNNYKVNFYLIDLTLMFGSNEPNLQQAQDLFVSNYYAYNSGSAVAFSTLTSYTQGFNDALSNLDATFDGQLLSTNVFGVNSTVTNANNLGWDYVVNNTNSSTAIYGFNFPSSLNSGDIINFSFGEIAISDAVTNKHLEIGYYDNGVFSTIADIDLTNFYYGQLSLGLLGNMNVFKDVITSITLNRTISAIYFKLYGVNGASGGVFAHSNIVVKSTNFTYAISDAYQQGYDYAKKYYDDYYSPNGSGYQAIYNRGYYDYPTDDHFTFQKLIYSVIDVPVQAFTNLFDYDILGVNMKTFYLSLFTLAVIVTIIRLVL